ncbi:MAG: HTH domain-containing protein [Eisenbergiella massiliensis]
MNRQTSKLLTILLNSPGQYFHYEELAARFHVSTRSIRNYVQSILEFLEDQNLQPVLSVSEGGNCIYRRSRGKQPPAAGRCG